ncbi:rhodanese-like domain-containing protein [Ottowia thiooxydans]|uniref:rhodanese-like domain-containing protein n=1 Tax=Ottowia thiooxydans TaxID=219182 RepID=UPI0006852EF2|nr:rhodanese-like domain-containing protein [Ottowia thiooxydans]
MSASSASASARSASQPTSWPTVDARQVHAMLSDGQELAFLDVREEGVFHAAHPLFVVSAPFSHLEMRLADLVPRRDTRMVLMDAEGEGLSERAAERMAEWGYSHVAVLKGGLQAWRDAGLQVFSGIYVPSKAFGEFVEHSYGTPSIDAQELKTWISEGRDMVILDSRPYSEFHNYSLPGGINCPGAELVHRVFDLVERESTTVVVNCAGRTRGIIGAQSLINAGLRNPVVCVRNGTQGWHLSGETMASGSKAVAPPPTLEGLNQAIEASQRVAKRFGVREIDAARLRELQAQAGERTLYLFDVRTPEEYEAGHIPGARTAPGGQLVQSTDHYVGTRSARIVLCDDNGVRARMTASWLIQLGWTDVFVLQGGLSACGQALEKGPEVPTHLPVEAGSSVRKLGVLDVQQKLKSGEAVVVDLSSSLRFRDGHISGAWFAVRSRLANAISQLPAHKLLVLTSLDGKFAEIAATDAQAVSPVPVAVLQGGNAAWTAAGLTLEPGLTQMTTSTDDVWYSPYDHVDRTKAMNAYLSWEIGLVEQMEREDGALFQYFASEPA